VRRPEKASRLLYRNVAGRGDGTTERCLNNFLNDAPGKEIPPASVAVFYVEMLDDAVFDFSGSVRVELLSKRTKSEKLWPRLT